jgi:hypothetical protein
MKKPNCLHQRQFAADEKHRRSRKPENRVGNVSKIIYTKVFLNVF